VDKKGKPKIIRFDENIESVSVICKPDSRNMSCCDS